MKFTLLGAAYRLKKEYKKTYVSLEDMDVQQRKATLLTVNARLSDGILHTCLLTPTLLDVEFRTDP